MPSSATVGHGRDHLGQVPDHQALGDLQGQPGGVGPGLGQDAADSRWERGLPEGPGAHVGRDPYGTPGELGADQQLTDRAQDPHVDLDDEVGLLRERDERVGHDQSPLGLLPPDERLSADHVGLPVHLGLEVHAQLALGNGPAQRSLHLEPIASGLAHPLGEERGPAPPGPLRPIHRGVRAPQDVIRRLLEIGLTEHRHADAGGDGQLLGVAAERCSKGCVHHLGHGVRVPTGRFGVRIQGVQEDGELVPLEPCDRVVRAQRDHQATGDLQQDGVPDCVPARLVDELEPVDVEHQEGAHPALPLADPLQLAEAVQQQGAVGQSGPTVVERDVVQVLLGLALICDIEHEALKVRLPTVVGADQAGLVAHGQPAPGPGGEPVLGCQVGAGPLGAGYLVEDPVAVLGVDQVTPGVRVRQPFLGRVPEGLDLGADVGGATGGVRSRPVDDGRHLLGQCPIAGFPLAQPREGA